MDDIIKATPCLQTVYEFPVLAKTFVFHHIPELNEEGSPIYGTCLRASSDSVASVESNLGDFLLTPICSIAKITP